VSTTDRRVDLVVLLGPPGAGKTQLGHRLARDLGLDFEELEYALLAQYGSRDAFAARKAQALAELEADLVRRVRASRVPVVIESTGLSDREMLGRLARDHRVLFVRVSAPEETCVQRVARRVPGRNFSNDPDAARGFHRHWIEAIAPTYRCDLELESDGDLEPLVASVAALLAAR
jgi:shikimate kinase